MESAPPPSSPRPEEDNRKNRDAEMAAAYRAVEWQGVPSVNGDACSGFGMKNDQTNNNVLSATANPTWNDVSETSELGSSTSSARSSTAADNMEPEADAISLLMKSAKQREFMGIKNQGTTCYLNCIIQSLFFTPEFRDMVFNWDPLDLPIYSLPKALQNIFIALRMSDKAVIAVELTSCPEWVLCGQVVMQHDVQEFTSKLFESLEESLSRTNCGRPFRHLLYTGKLIDYTQCKKCNTLKQHEDIIQDITLPVHEISSLEEALSTFVKPEELTGSNQYHCDVCATKCDATKGLILKNNPFILSIVLKRFTSISSKMSNRVTFPSYLCMDEYTGTVNDPSVNEQKDIDTSSKNKAVPSEKEIYELFVVHVHTGTVASGHYFSYIKSFETNRWFKLNDEIVSEVNQNEVIPSSDENMNNCTDKNAYTLLYRKLSSTKEDIKIESYEIPQRIVDNLPTLKDDAKLHLYFKNVAVDMVGLSKLPWQHVIWQKGLSVKEIISKALTHFKIATPLSMFRLVKIYHTNLMIVHSYDDEEEILNESHKEIHMWLQMRDSDEPFRIYPKSNMNLNVIHLDTNNLDIKDVKMLNIDIKRTIKELKEEVAQVFDVPKKDLQLVAQSKGALPKALSDDEGTLATALLTYPFRLYAINQSVKDSDESTKMCEQVDELATVAQIYMRLPLCRNTENEVSADAEPTVKSSMSAGYIFTYTESSTNVQPNEDATDRRVLFSIDTRGSSTWLSGCIQKLLKVNSRSEVLYLFTEPVVGPSSPKILERYTPMKEIFGDYKSDVMYPTFEITGKVMSETELAKITVSLFNMDEREKHLFKKVEVTAQRGVMISQLKTVVIQQFAERHGVNLVHDCTRLRELEGIFVSKVHHDMTKLAKIVESSSEAKMCIQPVPEKQKLFSVKKDCYFIFMQEYLPNTDVLGKVNEMFLCLNDTDEMCAVTNAIQLIADVVQAPADNLLFLLAPTKYPSRLPAHKKSTASWNSVQELKKILDEIYSDGQVIFYRKSVVQCFESFYKILAGAPIQSRAEFVTPPYKYKRLLMQRAAYTEADTTLHSEPSLPIATDKPDPIEAWTDSFDKESFDSDKYSNKWSYEWEPAAKAFKSTGAIDWIEEYTMAYSFGFMESEVSSPNTPMPSPTSSCVNLSDDE